MFSSRGSIFKLVSTTLINFPSMSNALYMYVLCVREKERAMRDVRISTNFTKMKRRVNARDCRTRHTAFSTNIAANARRVCRPLGLSRWLRPLLNIHPGSQSYLICTRPQSARVGTAAKSVESAGQTRFQSSRPQRRSDANGQHYDISISSNSPIKETAASEFSPKYA